MKTPYVPIFATILALSAGCSFAAAPTDENVTVDLPGDDTMQDEFEPADTIHDEGRPDEGGQDLGDTASGDQNGGHDDSVVPDGGGQDLGITDDGQPSDALTDVHVPRGRITVIPYLIDFGYVPLSATSTVPITVRNDGDYALRLDKFETIGPASIMLDVGFEAQTSGSKTTYVVDPPKALKPGETYDGRVVFEPTTATEAYSEIRVYSSDTDYPTGYLVHAMGNKTKPDVDLVPASMDFGACVIGSPLSHDLVLKSVGGMNVKIKAVYPNQAAIDAGWRVEFPTVEPTVSSPVTLAPVQTLTVRIVYDPTRASPVDSIGKPVTEEGQIIVSGDMFAGNEFLRVTGFAVEGACTRPIIELLNDFATEGDGCPVDEVYDWPETKNTRIRRTADGFEVPTGTLIRLSGEQSFSPFGDLASYSWAVNQPEANGGVFIPDSGNLTPTFMVSAGNDDTVQYYEIFLNVTDVDGHTACALDSLKITTRTEVKSDVILSWTPVNPFTPTPPYMGQDVDLHFTHRNAADDGTEPDIDGDGVPDDWFDYPWDCYWLNPEPAKDQWGEALPRTNDLVRLRNDSDDGAEPEVLSMGLECPNGNKFKVGAYYFDDHGYGDVYATVQVFVKGQLLYDATQRLTSLDMWYVGDLGCLTCTGVSNPSPLCDVALEKEGSFTTTSARVTHNYVTQ